MGHDQPLRPKDWSAELQAVIDLSSIPGMTVARALRILETTIPAREYAGTKNAANQEAARIHEWPKLNNGTPLYRLGAVAGRATPLLSHLNNEIIQPVVADLVTDATDAIVELGCGMARHLLGLRDVLEHRFPRLRYYGADLSESALATSATIAALESNRALVTFHKFNYLEPDFGFISQQHRGNVVFFSCHSIEQVSGVGRAVFEAMIATATIVTGVHEEPFGWQMKGPTDSILARAGSMPQAMGWNWDLHEVLTGLERQGLISLRLLRHCSGNHVYNPGSLAVWHKAVDGLAERAHDLHVPHGTDLPRS